MKKSKKISPDAHPLDFPYLTRSNLAEKLTFDPDSVVDDAESSRTMEFSFSSETPVERWFGNEILSHAEGACDYSRLNDGAPLLYNHDEDRQLGVIEKGWTGPDRRGYVRVRFSKSAFAQEKLIDIKDSILRNVSFGYIIDEIDIAKPEPEQEINGEGSYLVKKYVPYEVSFVSIPADGSVGVGRELDGKKNEALVTMIRSLERRQKNINAKKSNVQNEQEGDSMGVENNELDLKVIADDAVKLERERTQSILALGEKHAVVDLARTLIESGKSLDEARCAVLEVISERQTALPMKDPLLGMSQREVKEFSFLRAINALANPLDKKAQEAAKFERECSDAASQVTGKAPRGFLVPQDVLRAPVRTSKRFLAVGAPAAGGNLVDVELKADSFIDMLRQTSVLQRAGATTLTNLTSSIAIPRQSGGATAYWIPEGTGPAASQPTFDQVALTPKTVAGYTDISRKLLLQSGSIDIENLVRRDLATVISLEVDRAGLYGSGSANQPLGLKNQTGVNTVALAGVIPTFAETIQMETECSLDNANVVNMKYVVNAGGRGALKGAVIAAGQPIFIWNNDNINGYQAEVSNQVASGDYWFGNFSDFILAFWSNVDIVLDPYSLSTSGTLRIVAMQDVDVAVRHPESFCRANKTL